MELDSVAAHVEIVKACKDKIAALEKMAERSRAVIEEQMGDDDTGTVGGKLVVTWKYVKKRSLSQKLLKAMYPDIAEECTETMEYRRMEFK